MVPFNYYLADLASVKAAALEILRYAPRPSVIAPRARQSSRGAHPRVHRKESKLDVLFNSGGVMFPPVEQLTADGYDLQFGTNVLGACARARSLVPRAART